ncbi:hypothetical protein A5844_001504 [Enterococcus sp. 10A9_DIV0425]|uniref:Uncharacterized protein n=1 Tax=Candidatus Enterococcus wittei TaxID=1987383 RepID=A0A242K128_9ENTE|nr:hypothetical protein [Enterococcus sp. 10A9_DIV0425]OTP11369.1 hypothetical protein A5844_001504 [Enterococcus sp. 10A9_DIV0425]THE09475.1 hypothetical protein E1H99_10950 [Enterococcus hirae]
MISLNNKTYTIIAVLLTVASILFLFSPMFTNKLRLYNEFFTGDLILAIFVTLSWVCNGVSLAFASMMASNWIKKTVLGLNFVMMYGAQFLATFMVFL